jgi:integrin alpha FG-GAP repeat containing protein 1
MRLRASRRVLRAAIVSACLIPLVTAAWWPFPPKRFTGNGLLPAGPLGLDNDERVIAFGDFNNDQ